MPCYPTALPSSKVAYFVQFLKEKLSPVQNEFLVTKRSGTYFFREIALLLTIWVVTLCIVVGRSSVSEKHNASNTNPEDGGNMFL
jgi:hypothetical protein